jgi:hypothetical protein
MTSILLPVDRRASVAALVLIMASAAWAQMPDQPSMTPDRSKARQPTPSSVQQSETLQGADRTTESEADRKMREMDRKLDRVLRSICDGC